MQEQYSGEGEQCDDIDSTPPHEVSSAEPVSDTPQHEKDNSKSRFCCKDMKKKGWGGKFVEEIHSVGGDFNKYSDIFSSVDGIVNVFDSSNAIARTISWLIAFLAFLYLFLYLTIPLIQDYRERSLTTSLNTKNGENGLPLPIVTVCPHSTTGARCDCVLWRRLHCRYTNDVPSFDWMKRFDQFACWNYFEDVETLSQEHPTWISPNCEDFDVDGGASLVDPCGPFQSEIELEPSLEKVTQDTMFQRIVSRESSSSGPYMTYEELLVYGAWRMNNNVFFVRRVFGDLPKQWITYSYLDRGRMQLCAQLRPPNNDPFARQTSLGLGGSLSVIVTGLTENQYSLQDMQFSSPAVDININLNQGKEVTMNDTFVTDPVGYSVFGASFHTSIQYTSKELRRYQGWGSDASRTCKEDGIPREVCASNFVLDNIAEKCRCKQAEFLVDSPEAAGCAVTDGNPQTKCFDQVITSFARVPVSVDDCPYRCVIKEKKTTSVSSSLLSNGQTKFLRNKFNLTSSELNRTSTAALSLGYSSFVIQVVEESPKTTFSSLMGTFGGNLGFFCGLSFLSALEIVEFTIVAVLFGNKCLARK